MSDNQRSGDVPQTSGSAARGTEGGGGEPPEHLPHSDADAADGERMKRAQREMADAELDHPIEGEGTTEEGRRNAVATATGPETEASPEATSSRGPDRDEPNPGAVSGNRER